MKIPLVVSQISPEKKIQVSVEVDIRSAEDAIKGAVNSI
jgi:hypothetical protein